MKLLIIFCLLISATALAEVCRIQTQQDFSASTVSIQARPESRSRKCLVYQNNGLSTVYIRYTSAHTGTENFTMASGSRWDPIIIPVNAIFIKSAAGVVPVTIIEGQ